MATGDIALEVAEAFVQQDSVRRESVSGSWEQVNEATFTSLHYGGPAEVRVTHRKSLATGAPASESAFDATKRYKITVTEV